MIHDPRYISNARSHLQYWRSEVQHQRTNIADLAEKARKISADLKDARRKELVRMLKRWFALFDMNSDGAIEEAEYLRALEVQLRSKFFFTQSRESHREDLAMEWKAFVAVANPIASIH